MINKIIYSFAFPCLLTLNPTPRINIDYVEKNNHCSLNSLEFKKPGIQTNFVYNYLDSLIEKIIMVQK